LSLTFCNSGTPTGKDEEVKKDTAVEAVKSGCDPDHAVETDGYRRLAFIVGVGQYKSEKIPDLIGPPADARRFYDLLTDRNGYGFPKENVCMLLDEEATKEQFKKTFDRALVQRARKNDVAVIFYAGHGSQTKDRNDDEPDNRDETYLLHDVRTEGIRDLVDDEFNSMLARLHRKTKNIALFIDSCNSGTATRGEGKGLVPRFFKPMDERKEKDKPAEAAGDSSGGWTPEDMPGIVVFTAASDGTAAYEVNGSGIFTDALTRVMYQVGDQPLTYAQVARQVRPLVAAKSYQIPYFQGDLNRPVFANKGRTRPIGWDVISTGPPIELGGPALPGIGVGAELRIYSGSVTGADTQDPGKAKATVVMDEVSGLNGKGHVSAMQKDAPPVVAGDLAVLTRVADEFLKVKVFFRPEQEPGGVPVDRARKVREAIENNNEARLLVEISKKDEEFELSMNPEGQLVLRGPENRVRNTFATDTAVSQNLWQHARQKALLELHGEGGSDFKDNYTLQVRLVEAAKQSPCADGTWEQAEPNEKQIIPLCQAWNIEVGLSEDSPFPLLIGGVILSTDGSIFGLPYDGRTVLLKSGETVTLNARGETFIGAPPLDVEDHVIVFGTKETNPVPWHLLTSTAITRAAGPPKSSLYRALDGYFQPGTRGTMQLQEDVEDTTWTLSRVTMRVEANQRFLKPASKTSPLQNKREYTIANFDIRPYLPDDTSTALHRVFEKADRLARSSIDDGFGYQQHDWSLPTDEENLKRGIDCSRAIWFAFTRSGLPYNRNDQYLTTAMMVSENTAMADKFESCSDDAYIQPGDILVYRDDTRGDGHVVMVIDPVKRIAWGSHGWDGNAKKLNIEPDTGVEYQLIKYKQDWARWDRTTMERKACWRYKDFIKEAVATRGLLGVKALAQACDPRQCR
jgi:hypothetical protein